MTDLTGVMESWDGTTTVVRREDGSATAVPLADIVSGKPVPPRPSVRMRVTPEEACRLSNRSWPAQHTQPLGEWLLRASGGFSARANSVMATGDPGVGFGAALAQVRGFYGERGLPAWAQVVAGSANQSRFEAAGWGPARPGEADTHFQLASVAMAARAARRLLPAEPPKAAVQRRVTAQWLADDDRARDHLDAAVAVLEGPEQVAFVAVEDPAAAKGRVACHGDWAGLTDVWVHPAHRRRGLATAVLSVMLEWAAERGATTAYLQVRGDNEAALSLYRSLGFRTHHRYRYLAAPR
jgi:ribosomal protein S18 acetylase RimI-like enzyme